MSKKLLPPIYGFNETSEMGKNLFAPSIFLGGCNMRCPYCMNSQSVFRSVEETDLSVVKKHVEEMNPEWLMISGGEPTLTKTSLLINLIEEIKSWGVSKIGMSTNGTRPDTLKDILPLINYVAMDLKTISDNIYKEYYVKEGRHEGEDEYANPNKPEDIPLNLFDSTCFLKMEKVAREDFDFEFRTTLYPEFINDNDIIELSEIVNNETWILQPFRRTKFMLDKKAEDVEPYSEETVRGMVELASKNCKNVELRYV